VERRAWPSVGGVTTANDTNQCGAVVNYSWAARLWWAARFHAALWRR